MTIDLTCNRLILSRPYIFRGFTSELFLFYAVFYLRAFLTFEIKMTDAKKMRIYPEKMFYIFTFTSYHVSTRDNFI